MDLVYIGDAFYHHTGSKMSSIYERRPDGNWARSDWGKVNVTLRGGEHVLIRPATPSEMDHFLELARDTITSSAYGYATGGWAPGSHGFVYGYGNYDYGEEVEPVRDMIHAAFISLVGAVRENVLNTTGAPVSGESRSGQ